MASAGPVFVVGMPRSGTTLMRSIVNAHPSIAVAGETHLIDHWMQVHRDADLTGCTDRDDGSFRFAGRSTVAGR